MVITSGSFRVFGRLAVSAFVSVLMLAPGALGQGDDGLPAAKPMRVTVFGSGSSAGSAAWAAAALVEAEKERGITINTSHVEYKTVSRVGSATAVGDDAGTIFGAAVLVGTDGDVADVLETAQLTSLLGIQPAFVLLAGGVYGDDQLAALADGLSALGYTAETSGIFVMSPDPAACLADEAAVQLYEALEQAYVYPDPAAPFLMAVDEVLETDEGPVAYGYVESGVINSGDVVDIVGDGKKVRQGEVANVELFRQILDRGQAGDNVGVLLRGVKKQEIRRGMVIAKPGSTTPHSEFKAEIYILKKEEGGRHTPFHNKYRPQFYVRTAEVTGEIRIDDVDGVPPAEIQPGDTAVVSVKLSDPVALADGQRFAIREGGRTVGAGQVTEIIK